MRIVLVEDNEMLANGVQKALHDVGHAVDWLADGVSADDFLASSSADLAVIDVNLPEMSGFEVLRGLRRRGDQMPVLILTARGDTADRVEGLDAGADDYLVKPFAMAELLARIRALARRRAALQPDLLTFGSLRFDRVARRLDGPLGEIPLPRREMALFEFLLDHRGRITSKDAIVEALYGTGADVETNAVELLISRLRRRLAGGDVAIRTARGLGYMLDEANERSS